MDVFKEILVNEFNLSEVSDNIFAVCIQLFQDRQKEFHQAVILFNAWYACLIEIKNKTPEKTGANLDEKFPKNFIDFTLDSICQNYDLEKIKQTFPKALEISQEDLNPKIIEFKNCEQHKIFRGKYEMEFLLRIIELIINDSINTKQYIQEKINFSFGAKLSNDQALKVFSAYAETPNSLNDYLRQVINQPKSKKKNKKK